MISRKMIPLMKNNSAIRMMFEEGNKLAAKYGRENVFDFSLGNPSVPAPAEVKSGNSGYRKGRRFPVCTRIYVQRRL